jgi:hypothetical protein
MNLRSCILSLVLAVPLCSWGQRFQVSDDGHQVADRATGLVWKRCPQGQTWNGTACAGGLARFSFDFALVLTENPSGWRIPTVQELFTIADHSAVVAGSPLAGNENGDFWISTTQAAAPAMTAWLVNFRTASTIPSLRFAAHPVRLVRSSPAAPEATAKASRFRAAVGANGQAHGLLDCVIDETTGLMWEGKPADGSFRDRTLRYTHFDRADQPQVAVANGVPMAPTAGQISAPGNALAYVKAVNAVALCGFADWRLPSLVELHALADMGKAPRCWTPIGCRGRPPLFSIGRQNRTPPIPHWEGS